ncbi:MAG: catalase [Terriglobales bacterium]
MLNPNRENCFAKIGQAAFNPEHFVPGIGLCSDKMLQGRLFSSDDTHRCRLGAHHTLIASQLAPLDPNYSRGGSMRTDGDAGRTTRTSAARNETASSQSCG